MPYTYEYPRPAVTVDAAVFRASESGYEVLLIRRGNEPFRGMWALPGGFVNMDETLEEAVARELKEETSLDGVEMEQLHTFSAVNRDPRHRTISTVFYGILNNSSMEAEAGDDASETRWFHIGSLPPMAFDHNRVIGMAVKRIGKPVMPGEL
ncbi:MAG TPA: NUDIX hydrolase [Bacteroidales bacterium]|nr:NUDIX hydrolase [Bacteroidales bacterium]HPT03109.1 NUDIX hydrolase [Bacteroidales bacterium]